MKNQEKTIEEVQELLFEARSLVKICALATDSCITDKEFELKDFSEFYLVLKYVNARLANIENALDVYSVSKN